MKTINLIVSVSIALLSTYKVSAQNKYFENNSLSVKGQALLHGNPSSSYTVSVYLSGHKIDSMKSKSKRPIYFNFKFGCVCHHHNLILFRHHQSSFNFIYKTVGLLSKKINVTSVNI